MKNREKILVFDGNNLLHRMYHIAAAYNGNARAMTMNNILKMIDEFGADKIIFTWDERYLPDHLPKPNVFRKEISPEYKGGRNEDNNNAVYAIVPDLIEALRRLGVCIILPHELEADDVMAYIAYENKGKDDITIISADKDILQLLTEDCIEIYSPIIKMLYTKESFENKFQIPIEQYWLYKCILGDTSDNIQGLRGIGDKRARKYLSGESTFTHDQQTIIDHNIKMMDLRLISNDDHEVAARERLIYSEQMSDVREVDEESFNFFVDFYKANIDNKIDTDRWRKAFFNTGKPMTNLLDDITSKYFT